MLLLEGYFTIRILLTLPSRFSDIDDDMSSSTEHAWSSVSVGSVGPL